MSSNLSRAGVVALLLAPLAFGIPGTVTPATATTMCPVINGASNQSDGLAYCEFVPGIGISNLGSGFLAEQDEAAGVTKIDIPLALGVTPTTNQMTAVVLTEGTSSNSDVVYVQLDPLVPGQWHLIMISDDESGSVPTVPAGYDTLLLPELAGGNDLGLWTVFDNRNGQQVFVSAYSDAGDSNPPVPGPIAGAGIPGLLFGGGLLAWWRRRRKKASA
jgi:hypothetical protein